MKRRTYIKPESRIVQLRLASIMGKGLDLGMGSGDTNGEAPAKQVFFYADEEEEDGSWVQTHDIWED